MLGARSEEGTGLIGTLAGFAVFIVLLLLAVQVVFDLYVALGSDRGHV